MVRAAIHWDDAEMPKEVVMRPASRGTEEWHWSGSFRLSTREEYFGLRVRSKVNRDRAINVPVNCTVGPSGTPQIFLEMLHGVMQQTYLLGVAQEVQHDTCVFLRLWQ